MDHLYYMDCQFEEWDGFDCQPSDLMEYVREGN